MQPKVSVIVPIYNARPYLSHCLETLTHQTLEDLELILVLDCPTDGSDEVAEEYARTYGNICLVRNERNLHASESRNRGLKIARGEYIGFADADDFQELRMYEDMYRIAKQEDADVVLVDRKNCTPEKCESVSYVRPTQVQGGREFLQENLLRLVRGNFKLYTSYLYTHLYRRKFIEEEGIVMFDSRTMMAEDLLFNIQVYHRLLQRNGKLVHIPQVYYYYMLREGSLCHTLDFYTFDMTIPLLVRICREMEGSKVLPETEVNKALGARVIDKLYSAFCKEVKMYGPGVALGHLKEYREMGELTGALKRYAGLYDTFLPFKKNVFGYLLRIFS